MASPWPNTLSDILALKGADFGVAFYEYLVEKKNTHALVGLEEEAWLLLTMLLDIEMEGFVDLFYQLYSLRECAIVETGLRRLELFRLAELFAEAKTLYTGGRFDLTEEEYRTVDWTDGDERWKRFDAIGEAILASGSEIYLLSDRVERYVKSRLM